MTKSAPRWAATRSASCARASCRWRQASAPRNDTNLKTRSPRARMERRAGMIRLDGHDRITDPLRGGVIALGNFDGFHAGHQAVVGRAVQHAKDDGRPCIVATFDPHPVRFFKRSEEHTSELQSLMGTSYAVFCLTNTLNTTKQQNTINRRCKT